MCGSKNHLAKRSNWRTKNYYFFLNIIITQSFMRRFWHIEIAPDFVFFVVIFFIHSGSYHRVYFCVGTWVENYFSFFCWFVFRGRSTLHVAWFVFFNLVQGWFVKASKLSQEFFFVLNAARAVDRIVQKMAQKCYSKQLEELRLGIFSVDS